MSRIMGLIHDEAARQGHQVEYFCAEDAPSDRIHPALARFTFPLAVARHAGMRARQGRPYDVINVHEPSGAALILRRRALGGARIVVTSHGVEERAWKLSMASEARPAEQPRFKTRLLYPSTVLWQANLALRKADHIFCLNSEDKAYLMSRFHRRGEEITRIFPGADPIYGRRAAERDYHRARTLLFAASWLVRKGIDDVVAAFVSLAERYPELRLKVLNPGVEASQVLNRFPEPLRGRVECVRAQPEEGLAAVLEEADIFLLPSLFEGTPLTLIEAMWSGLPIVTTAVCGMKDVIVDGVNGLLTPPRRPEELVAALRKLLDDEASRRNLGQAAQRDAQAHYRWKDAACVAIAAYERVSPDRLSPRSQSERLVVRQTG
jgi:glycosyltransferase involved in cell wall biosynthesis